ncbi:hypothetical protein [Nocardia sputi]|nr:hypothetical protein [Nocardia sputi]
MPGRLMQARAAAKLAEVDAKLAELTVVRDTRALPSRPDAAT